MSLSFYNLIPSCTICNSSAKGDALFKFETHIHPYLNDKPNPTFKFGYLPNGKRWTVDFIDVTDVKEKQMLDDFHLRELYHCHDNLEVSELLNLALKIMERTWLVFLRICYWTLRQRQKKKYTECCLEQKCYLTIKTSAL